MKKPVMKKPDYFMNLNLPEYGKIGLIEAKGIHYFNAFSKAKGDSGLLFKFLLLEVLMVNDNFVNEEFLNEMQMKDVAYLVTILGTMMEDKII